MIGIIVLLFRENWLIGAGMLLFLFFAIFVIQQIRKFVAPLWGQWRQANAEFYGFIGEQVEGTEDIRANGAVNYVMGRSICCCGACSRIRMKAFFGFASMWSTTILVFALGNAMALR